MINPVEWQPSSGLILEPNALRAAKEIEHNLALTAGPGAGKTEMLAQRADFLLRCGVCRYPRRILAISFKVDAAQNLKARVHRRCRPELAARFDSHTFHAFSKRLIDRFRPALRGQDELDYDYSIGERRVQNKSITFQDLVPLAHKIIIGSSLARNIVQQTYSHVFLDEFQDCTSEQYALIKSCFMQTSTIITAVGDTKQSIMGWAGALDGIFNVFANDFSAKPLNLYQNFRSQPRLRRMQNAMIKVMDPPAAANDADIIGDAGCISVVNYNNDENEAEGVRDIVLELVKVDRVPLSEIAVLVCRQQTFFCQKLVAAFAEAGIPYREEDTSQELMSEPVARVIIDFFSVILGAREAGAYRRLLDQIVLSHGFDEDHEYRMLSMWRRFIIETRESLSSNSIDLTNRQASDRLIDSVLNKIGHNNIVSMSAEYERGDRLKKIVADIKDRVCNMIAASSNPLAAFISLSEGDAVRIMSIHKSKGLEFEAVIILGVENQTFWAAADKERPVYFVGISRAKNHLFITYCNQRSRPNDFPGRRWDTVRTRQEEFVKYALDLE